MNLEIKLKSQMLLFAAARAAFASRKVKLKAMQQAGACCSLGAGYGDAVRAALAAEQLLIQLLLPAVTLSKAPDSVTGMSVVPAAPHNTPRQQCSAGSKPAQPSFPEVEETLFKQFKLRESAFPSCQAPSLGTPLLFPFHTVTLPSSKTVTSHSTRTWAEICLKLRITTSTP